MKKETEKKSRKTTLIVAGVMGACVLASPAALKTATPEYIQKKNDSGVMYNNETLVEKNISLLSNEVQSASDYVYLSDIQYIKDQSSVGWGSITLDGNLETQYNNGLITLLIDGKKTFFLKGISAHATSTIVYDFSAYDYDYFSTYIGVDESRGNNGNGVKFQIYTSEDGENWELKTEDTNIPVLKGNSNALFKKIDIKNAKYLKLYCHNNGNATADHAVYANAKLYKEGYVEKEYQTVDFIKTVEEYDEILKDKTLEQQLNEYEQTLLQRKFVNSAGYDLLQAFVNQNDENKETIEWLMSDLENLRLYVLGGTPDGGSYYNSMKELTRLYNTYKEDFKNAELINNEWCDPNMTKGDLYKKMAITLSLTHSTKVGYWAQIDHPSNRSDSLERYRIYKYLYDNGKFVVSSRQDHTPWFEALTVEEMRYVMNNITDDEELIWLNEYTQKRIDAHPNEEEKYLQPHTYIAYVNPNFDNPIFHDPAKKDYWDEKFEGIFSKYGVTYSTENDKVYKAWMSMRNEYGTGAVCGGISKLGTHIRAAHGTPASVISQPGHAAIIYYRKNAEGKGYWSLDNDVFGWAKSGKTAKLSVRMPLGWGNDSYVSGWPATYVVLAQEAMNDNENYEKSQEIIMVAELNSDNKEKQEELYREALKVQKININAWWGLISVYNSDETKTEEDYYNLAKELGDALMPFPLPMDNLLNKIKSKLTSTEYQFKYTLLETKFLNEGKTYNATDRVLQPNITRTVATFLLGETDTSLATFSFDGENAEKIILSSKFDNNGIRWDYSVDGKTTWKEVSFSADEEHSWKLEKSEIEKITSENDIYIHIVGTDYTDENLYKIDIQEQDLLTNLYANDLENRIVGINESTQWRYGEGDEWTSYKDSTPDLTGDKTIQIRQVATGTKLASKPSEVYNFTEDNQPNTRKYIPVSNLSIHSVSTQAVNNNGAATNSIDANYNTRWHSAWNGTDTERFIVIKLENPVNLSAVEFVPAGGGNGKILDGTIYGSMNGDDWEELTNMKNLTYSNQANTIADAIANTKSFEIAEPKEVQYVKIVADRASNGNWFTARAFNLYEDITKKLTPTADIEYSTTEETTGKVVARLVNPSANITITNNGGSGIYEFTENGEFTFEFEDEYGNKGTAVAKVTWIKKDQGGNTGDGGDDKGEDGGNTGDGGDDKGEDGGNTGDGGDDKGEDGGNTGDGRDDKGEDGGNTGDGGDDKGEDGDNTGDSGNDKGEDEGNTGTDDKNNTALIDTTTKGGNLPTTGDLGVIPAFIMSFISAVAVTFKRIIKKFRSK